MPCLFLASRLDGAYYILSSPGDEPVLPAKLPKALRDASDGPLLLTLKLLRLVPGADQPTLDRLARQLADSLRPRHGARVLNPARRRPPSRSLVAIVDGDTRLTYPVAAARLGCTPKTLAKRLKNLRRRNPAIDTVDLAALRHGSDVARSYWRNTKEA